MKITSPAFNENAKIPKIYSKLGGNQRPPLEISDVPSDAKSLVIVCHDPDAPGRDGFYHWTVWNVPAKTTEITGESLAHGRRRRDYQLGQTWLGRAAAAVWHAPLSILCVRAGYDTGLARHHQSQRTHRRPHDAHHRSGRIDWKVWCVGYFAAGLSHQFIQ